MVGRCSRDGMQGKAFLYGTKTSLGHKHTQDDRTDLCNGIQMKKICCRVLILKHLLTKTMDPMYMENLASRDSCKMACDICQCDMCMCML